MNSVVPKIVRTNSNNSDFIALVKSLDDYLKTTDGDEHEFYNQFNAIHILQYVIVAYIENTPVGCGAFKTYNGDTVEIKRMYVKPSARKQGLAKTILSALENWSLEIGYKQALLETGKRQIEAVQFYKKCGYTVVPSYGQYQGMENSICYQKPLRACLKTM